MTTDTLTTATVRTEIEAQGTLEPGQEGWWKVWGATVRDIRPGDYVILAGDEFYVQDTHRPNTWPMRAGVTVDGERQTIGVLCNVGIFRRGTRHTLGDHVR